MSDMKCPFCNRNLHKGEDGMYSHLDYMTECKGRLFDGSKELWQELIRTREELHKANAELDYIKEQVEKSNAFIHARIKVAADQIASGIISQVKNIKSKKE